MDQSFTGIRERFNIALGSYSQVSGDDALFIVCWSFSEWIDAHRRTITAKQQVIYYTSEDVMLFIYLCAVFSFYSDCFQKLLKFWLLLIVVLTRNFWWWTFLSFCISNRFCVSINQFEIKNCGIIKPKEISLSCYPLNNEREKKHLSHSHLDYSIVITHRLHSIQLYIHPIGAYTNYNLLRNRRPYLSSVNIN